MLEKPKCEKCKDTGFVTWNNFSTMGGFHTTQYEPCPNGCVAPHNACEYVWKENIGEYMTSCGCIVHKFCDIVPGGKCHVCNKLIKIMEPQ